eukprot:111743-Rhodomonas_salina.2
MVVSAPVSMSIARTLGEATSLRKRLPRVHVCSATATLVIVKRASQRMVDLSGPYSRPDSLLASNFNHKPTTVALRASMLAGVPGYSMIAGGRGPMQIAKLEE